MNENINLCEILKDCPKGAKLYSPLLGEVYFDSANSDNVRDCNISVYTDTGCLYYFRKNGTFCYGYENGEIMLFPSKDVRTWEGWQCPKPKNPKFDPKTLKAFDKILARMKYGMWYADFISLPIDGLNTVPCVMGDKDFDTIIPYNDDTKHLLCTTDEAPEFYRYWED